MSLLLLVLLLSACAVRNNAYANSPEAALRAYLGPGGQASFSPLRTVQANPNLAVVLYRDPARTEPHLNYGSVEAQDGGWPVEGCCKLGGFGKEGDALVVFTGLALLPDRHVMAYGWTDPSVALVEVEFSDGTTWRDQPNNGVFAAFAVNEDGIGLCRARALDADGAILQDSTLRSSGCPAGATP